jgi:hypothetical protein
LEKEIEIELPLPKNQWRQTALLEAQAKHFERMELEHTAEDIRIVLQKLKETRTIKIKGKNVDDLDLKKIGELVQQANDKSSRVNLRGLFKSIKTPKQQPPK